MLFRSLVTQAVDPDEIGRIYSIFTLVGAILNSVAGALFQKIYNLTLDSLPGTFFLVVAGVILLAIPVNLVMRKLLKTFQSETKTESQSETTSF